jgi:hypothetical protein
MKEKYSCYDFEIKSEGAGYVYTIYGEGCMPYDDGVIESDYWYDTNEEAMQAAKDHIECLENGEQ